MKDFLLKIMGDYNINSSLREEAIRQYIKETTPTITEEEYRNMKVYLSDYFITKEHMRIKNMIIEQDQVVYSINNVNGKITVHKWLIRG